MKKEISTPVDTRPDGLVRLMTPDEVSELLHVSVRTLANWRSDGKGPAFIRTGAAIHPFCIASPTLPSGSTPVACEEASDVPVREGAARGAAPRDFFRTVEAWRGDLT